MTAQSFYQERLDVYRLSIDYVARSFEASHLLEGRHRHARGSALECAAIQDVSVTTKDIKVQDDAAMKAMLHRIVAMLIRTATKFDSVGESSREYDGEIDCDNEHRFAEHEHDTQTEETQEQCRPLKRTN